MNLIKIKKIYLYINLKLIFLDFLSIIILKIYFKILHKNRKKKYY